MRLDEVQPGTIQALTQIVKGLQPRDTCPQALCTTVPVFVDLEDWELSLDMRVILDRAGMTGLFKGMPITRQILLLFLHLITNHQKQPFAELTP